MGAKLFRVLLTFSILVLFSMSAMAATYYVDEKNGDDTSTTGSLNEPFKSIVYALGQVTTADATVIILQGNDDGIYQETLTLPAKTGFTLKAAAGASITLQNTANLPGPVMTIPALADGFTLSGVTVTSGNNFDTSPPTKGLIDCAAAVDNVKISNCSLTPGFYCDIAIKVANVTDGWRIENNTFNLSNQTDITHGDKAVYVTAGSIDNFLISNNAFTGPSNRNANPIMVDKAVGSVDNFDFTGNVVSRATCKFNFEGTTPVYEIMNFLGNVFEDSDAIWFNNEQANTATTKLGKLFTLNPAVGQVNKLNIIGNHFGSDSTDGSILYAILFYNVENDDIGVDNVKINYNHFQYPNTVGTMARTDMTTLGGHVSVAYNTANFNIDGDATAIALAIADATIDAKLNWWGSDAGAKDSYEKTSVSVVDAEFNDSQYLANTARKPVIDNDATTTPPKGIYVYDYDQNGQIDRAVLNFKARTSSANEYLDPASLTYDGFAIEGGFAFNTAKKPRVCVDSDNDGSVAASDLFMLTLFITESGNYDTGETPQITYTPTSTVKAITGVGEMAAFGTDDMTERDYARPVVRYCETVDNDPTTKLPNGLLDGLAVYFSENMLSTMTTANIVAVADVAFGADQGSAFTYTPTAANSVAPDGSKIVVGIAESAGSYNTGLKPQFKILSTVAVYKDVAGNLAVPVIIEATDTNKMFDKANPYAVKVYTRDYGSSTKGTGNPDGFIDGLDILFSEAVMIASADTAKAAADFSVDKAENTINLSNPNFLQHDTGALTGAYLSVKGISLKDAASGHKWDTDAIPLYDYKEVNDAITDTLKVSANKWVLVEDGVTTDGARPCIVKATAQIGGTNLYLTFSEGVTDENGGDLDYSTDFDYQNVNKVGVNATDIDATVDGKAEDAQAVLSVDYNFTTNDAANDSIKAISGKIYDKAGATPTQGNVIVSTWVSIYDGDAPILLTSVTKDMDSDGWIDHIMLTFDENINDPNLASYIATDKVDTAIAKYFSIAGYTVLGLNFVSDATELKVADPLVAYDVLNVGDVESDNLLWVIVSETSGADAVDGDTDAVPKVRVSGGADSSKVSDFTPNYMGSKVDLVSTDKAGPAIMSAMFCSETKIKVMLSEGIVDTVDVSTAYPGTPQLESGDFTILIGSNRATWSSPKDIWQAGAGEIYMEWTDDNSITAGNTALIGFTSAGAVLDLITSANSNTQLISMAKGVGMFTVAAFSGSSLSAPSALAIADVANDNGNWVIAQFTVSADHLSLVKSYQFYTRADAESAWILTAWVPAGIVDAENVMCCYVPVPVNGDIEWAVVASTGSILSEPVAAKAGDIAVAMLVEPTAAKAATGTVLSSMCFAIGGAVDNIAPSAITMFAGKDNTGAGAGIKISWTAPADHGIIGQYGIPGYYSLPIYGVDTYDVYRRTSAAGEFVKVGSAGPLSTSLVDEVADGITVYEYMVKYVDGNIEHLQSTGSVWAMANANANASDFNSDNKVNFSDFDMFVGAYGKAAGQAGWVDLFDLSPNGKIDFDDFDAFVGDYGFGAGKAAKAAVEVVIPESDIAIGMEAEVDASSSMYYVTVDMSDIASIHGFEFSMNYDSDALELVEESITGLVGLTIPSYEDGVINIANMFIDEEFNGSLTIGFRSLGASRGVVVELTKALVADNELGVSEVTDLSNASLRALPTVYALSKNFPNPFNPTTTIEYAIPAAGNVEMVIYNMTGQKVRTLVNEVRNAGFYKVVWDGRNEMGESVASGLYFYKLVSGNFNKIEKMTLVK